MPIESDVSDGSNDKADKKKGQDVSRRDFVAKLGTGMCLGGLGVAAMGILRSVAPSAYPDPSMQFKIGKASEFGVGSVTPFETEKVFVFRSENGFHAISSICTHLGCIVAHNEDGFACPCHGSRFALNGKVIQGPAPKGLPWFRIYTIASGQLVVDRATTVKRGTEYKANEGKVT